VKKTIKNWLHQVFPRKDSSSVKPQYTVVMMERKRNQQAETDAINARVSLLLKSLFLEGKLLSIGDTIDGYHEIKELWKNSNLFICYPFPILAIKTADDEVTLLAEWNHITDSQRDTLTVMIYGATGKFLHINEYNAVP
jgi:hypothetical protein